MLINNQNINLDELQMKKFDRVDDGVQRVKDYHGSAHCSPLLNVTGTRAIMSVVIDEMLIRCSHPS